jgi:hypothetical protein
MKHLLLFLLCQGSLDGFSQSKCPHNVTNCKCLRIIDTANLTGYGVTYTPCTHSDSTCRCLRLVVGQVVYGYTPPPTRDTLPEWMHISVTRAKGFVMARKALSVQVNGICVAHLDCSGKPFPVHYHVGWCEGKEELLKRLVKGRAGR